MNGPCHYDVQHWQSVCIKKSFTIFSVMLSNWRVQHLAGYRKWRVSLKNYRNQSLRVVFQKRCSAKEFFWNCLSALVFSCKLVAYLRKTFLEEHLGGLLLKYGVLCSSEQIKFQLFRWQLTNCCSVFEHFWGLALKGLKGTHLRENYFWTLTRVYFSVFKTFLNTKSFMANFFINFSIA